MLALSIIAFITSCGALYFNYKVWRIYNPRPLTKKELEALEQKILARKLARTKRRELILIKRQQKDALKRGFSSL